MTSFCLKCRGREPKYTLLVNKEPYNVDRALGNQEGNLSFYYSTVTTHIELIEVADIAQYDPCL